MRIRSGFLLATALFCFSGISVVAAQVRYAGEPVVLRQQLDADIPTFVLRPPDVAVLLAVDHFNEAIRIPGPLRYGVPLVGGHIHDWGWLLGRAGLLEQCVGISRVLHLAASAVVVGAWGWLARAAFVGRAAPREIAPRLPLFRRRPD